LHAIWEIHRSGDGSQENKGIERIAREKKKRRAETKASK